MAAYRDRYAIVGVSALGPVQALAAEPRDTAQARSALVAAKRIVEEQDAFATPRAGRARPQVMPLNPWTIFRHFRAHPLRSAK